MRIHFIAIGGAVMHQLAVCMHLQGHQVSGSDNEIFDPALSNLRKYKLIDNDYFWKAENISSDIDVVILGMHAKADNPELIRAKELNLKIMSFPEFIYEQTKNKKRIVVGGSHGKTTITSMIMHVLKQSILKFDYLVGSKLSDFDVMVSLSPESKYAIIEGDEYLASPVDLRPKFHLYMPDIAILSGIEWDHINVFPTFENYVEQFKKFIDFVPENGQIIYTSDDKNVCDVIEKYKGKAKLKPYKAILNITENGKTYITKDGCKEQISIFGEHNMKNMSAAYEVCKLLNINDKEFLSAMKTFSGAAKRLETIYENENTTVFRDFAHAPSKVRATVDAVKKRNPNRKLIAFFELHTYSSMNKKFIPQYKDTLAPANVAVVFYSPHAFKLKGLEPIAKTEIVKSFNRTDLKVVDDITELKRIIEENINENVNFLFMSSGNFDNLKIELLF